MVEKPKEELDADEDGEGLDLDDQGDKLLDDDEDDTPSRKRKGKKDKVLDPVLRTG